MCGMKNSRKIVLLLIPVLLVLSLYLSGYLTQFLYNYNTWRKEYGFSSGVSPKLPSGDFIECICAVFDNPYGLKGIGITFIVMIIITVFIIFKGKGENGNTDRKRNLVYSDSGN